MHGNRPPKSDRKKRGWKGLIEVAVGKADRRNLLPRCWDVACISLEREFSSRKSERKAETAIRRDQVRCRMRSGLYKIYRGRHIGKEAAWWSKSKPLFTVWAGTVAGTAKIFLALRKRSKTTRASKNEGRDGPRGKWNHGYQRLANNSQDRNHWSRRQRPSGLGGSP